MLARTSPNTLVLRMEDLLDPARCDETIARIGVFLALDLPAHTRSWWTRLSEHPHDPLKRALNWERLHKSSKIRPGRSDTEYRLAPHRAWDVLLPLFDRYADRRGSIAEGQVDRDMRALRALEELAPAPVSELYHTFASAHLSGGIAHGRAPRGTVPPARTR
ncbi:MAG: hypothetical protein MAG453_00631 [Calditrichaeota bacterium]|nr:hypothetical protein [Calditrichota bacterium]